MGHTSNFFRTTATKLHLAGHSKITRGPNTLHGLISNIGQSQDGYHHHFYFSPRQLHFRRVSMSQLNSTVSPRHDSSRVAHGTRIWTPMLAQHSRVLRQTITSPACLQDSSPANTGTRPCSQCQRGILICHSSEQCMAAMSISKLRASSDLSRSNAKKHSWPYACNWVTYSGTRWH
jgi:hypothetical protein